VLLEQQRAFGHKMEARIFHTDHPEQPEMRHGGMSDKVGEYQSLCKAMRAVDKSGSYYMGSAWGQV
jgi:hypothetical protein